MLIFYVVKVVFDYTHPSF